MSEQLDAAGYDRNRLPGVLVTHSHWDHVSGLDELRVPIWINPGERQLAGVMQVVPAHDRNAYEGIPRLPAVLPAEEL